MRLENVSAVVSGAGSGLGHATVAALSAGGARVLGVDIDVSNAPELDHVTYLKADVTKEDEVRRALGMAADTGPVRVVVNCAGIAPAARVLSGAGVHDLDLYARVVQVNLVGTFTLLALGAEAIAMADPLEDGQRGVIVNTASIAAYEGQIGQAAYASSKGGVVGLTLPAARDLAQYGIRVNTIAPGIVETPMLSSISDEVRAGLAASVPFPHRLARPSEFARLVCFVIDHDYINGETIRMDGALRMSPR